ncbi:MAG TPA: BMP family ABC transporter substrate-binding protein [Anaerolineales bacterium]
MNRNTIIALLVVVVIAIAVWLYLQGGGQQAVDCTSEDVLCVGFVTDVGRIDDASFNQASWEAVQQAEAELNATIDYVQTTSATDYEANIQLFVDDGYDVIVTSGFAIGDTTLAMSQANPDIYFIGVDQFVGNTANFAGVLFPEDQAGFQAGALAAMLTKTNIIAAVLGTDLVPPVVAFKEGYEAGAAYVNPDITVISTYHPGGLDVAFTDPEFGATTAAQAIDQGADVIFGAGGDTGNGALREVAGREGLYCIGVDVDQWNTVPEARPCLVTSAAKHIKEAVYDLLSQYAAGTPHEGLYFGGVGLAPYHDFESVVTAEMQAELDAIREGLADGSISTGYGQ